MNRQEKGPIDSVQHAARANWRRPEVRRVRAGEAEVTPNDVNADDIFS